MKDRNSRWGTNKTSDVCLAFPSRHCIEGRGERRRKKKEKRCARQKSPCVCRFAFLFFFSFSLSLFLAVWSTIHRTCTFPSWPSGCVHVCRIPLFLSLSCGRVLVANSFQSDESVLASKLSWDLHGDLHAAFPSGPPLTPVIDTLRWPRLSLL